jgi:hypothetical protein
MSNPPSNIVTIYESGTFNVQAFSGLVQVVRRCQDGGKQVMVFTKLEFAAIADAFKNQKPAEAG